MSVAATTYIQEAYLDVARIAAVSGGLGHQAD